jgi:CRISPR-associated protein Cas6
MRIRVLFEGEEVSLRKDYHSFFVSFVKSVFQRVNLLEEIFGEKKYKPYVFSVYFGKDFKADEEKIYAGGGLSFLFSSGDPLIITNFYNGALKLKEENFKIWNKNIEIKNIDLLPYRKIKSGNVIFKTVGICVLSNKEASKNDFKNFYIIPTDDLEKFNKLLCDRVNDRYRFLTERKDSHFIKLNPINIKEMVVKHYKGYLRGFKGIFELEGSPEILQFVYDYGLGIRTGQGFGLLEIVKEL